VVPTFTTYRFDGMGAQLCPCSFATSTPQAFLVASPPAHETGFGVARCRSLHRACAAARPLSTRFEPVAIFRGFNHWFTCITPFRHCLPDPRHLVVLTRPGFVRAACHPPLHFQGRTALSFTDLLRQAGSGPFHPTGYMAPRGALVLVATLGGPHGPAPDYWRALGC